MLPAIGLFFARNWRVLLEGSAVIALLVGAHIWLDRRDSAMFDKGAASVELRVKDAQARADAAERDKQNAYQLTNSVIDKRTSDAAQQLTIKLDPLNKALTNALLADPASHCRMSDGVRGNLETQRGAVNASLATPASGVGR